MNRALPSLHGGSLEIPLTVPLIFINFDFKVSKGIIKEKTLQTSTKWIKDERNKKAGFGERMPGGQ